jgi:ATP-dependent DNA helicase RecG
LPADDLQLCDALDTLHGVGPKKVRGLHKLGLRTVGDLLDYLPRDYRFESSERGVEELVNEQIQTVRGEVVAADYIPGRPRGRFEITVLDAAGEKMACVWFNAAWMRSKVRPGMRVRVRGKVRTFRNMPQMANPKWEAIDDDTAAIEEDLFRPIYAATGDLGSEQIETLIKDHLDAMTAHVVEWFPQELLESRHLLSRREAYRQIHRPRDRSEASEARRRIVYDELMLLQLGLAMSKRLREGRISAPVLRIDKTLDTRIRQRFPFEMTSAQQNAAFEIAHDLKTGMPMNRLLQGDVGSGKTVVALYAMLMAVANKLQAVMLAPTEVLAGQHYLTLSKFLAGSSVRIELLTGKLRKSQRESLHADLANGDIHIAVGTQALLSEGVDFANLGLVVVDEQHKLGVRQRAHLRGKGHSPHYLVMTATPIPRTLALSYLADFDVSTIDALPPGRQPIETRHLQPQQSEQAYGFVRRQVERGRQAYVVLPQIEDDSLGVAKSVKAHFDELATGPLKDVRLAMLHGQMKTEEKAAAMDAFRAGEADVLVATTVIEVGVDVPNATTMVIENAERFGLSQLHQLRGRVGRGSEQSYCVLVSEANTESARQRIGAMVETTDGFKLAEADLQLRGPGDFFGTRQHGLPSLRVADLSQEMELLHDAREDALALLAESPQLDRPDLSELRRALFHRYGETLQLALVG